MFKKLDRLASVVVHMVRTLGEFWWFTGSNTRGKSFKTNTASGLGVQLREHQLVTYEGIASGPSAGKKGHQGARADCPHTAVCC